MIKPHSLVNILIASVITAGVLLGLFFYLPNVLGDTIYPLKYQDLIVKYSALYKVDPSLTAAVIMQESHFNPSSVSGAGAKGLMQIMPSTASTIAKGIGVSSYNLLDPETAIEFGTWHLSVTLQHYNGNVDATLAAYNAGGGNADKWIRLGILGNIPFSETRNYVTNVKNYQKIYASLYAKELGLVPGGTAENFSTMVDKKEQPVTTTFWGMFFKNVFGVVTTTGVDKASQ